jgi:hypothetical protein
MRTSLFLALSTAILTAVAAAPASVVTQPIRPVGPEPIIPIVPVIPPPPAPLPPVRNAACLASHPAMTTPAGGTGALVDISCNEGYVLPPVAGKVTVASFSPTANVQDCPAVLGLVTQVDAVLLQLQNLQAEISAALAQVNALDAQLAVLGQELALASAANQAADQTLLNAMNDQTTLTAQVQTAQNAYVECIATEPDLSDCTTSQAGVASAQAALNAFNTGTYDPAQAASTAADAAYNQAFTAYENALNALSTALNPIIDLVAQLAAVNTTILSTYETYAALEGATGSLVFSVPWPTLVSAYRAGNPSEPWSWSPVSIDSASFYASALIGGAPTTVPALLSASLPGDGADGGTSASAGASVMSGGSETATIALSLVGACPYFPAGNPAAPAVTVDQSGLAAYVAANVVYTYAVEVETSFEQSLNSSPLAAKLTAVGIDPLGPTPAASLVRSAVSGQTLVSDMTAKEAQHTALIATVHSATTEAARVIIPMPPRPIVLYTKVEQTGTLTFVP